MIAQDLGNEQWIVRPTGDLSGVPAAVRAAPVPVRVPGCVHTDLMRAGLISDPTVGFNERDFLWIGKTDWEYRTSFTVSAELLARERVDLVCDGLDTIAEVSVNGRAVGSAANMFHPHRFDLRGVIREGENELIITFRSPLKHIRAEEARLGKRPVNGDWDPYIFIRKAACNLGWDWAPKVATCGVFDNLLIEAWDGVRLASVRPLIRRAGERWTLTVEADIEWSDTKPRQSDLRLEACLFRHPEPQVKGLSLIDCGQTRANLTIEVESPHLWWPRGHGKQALYKLEILLRAPGEDEVHCEGWVGNVAFREIRLNTDPDEHGEKFQLEINGQPIFCKGANWIPEGLFPDDRPPEKIRQRVRQAAAANMNMLRVWGGGFYESDEFYDECDRQGIMVWQDFMFACACYPEEAPYPALVEAEARHQIARLSSHASVVLWCGGNECVWGYESWGHAQADVEGPWKTRVGNKTWGRGYYFDLLPRLMRELDPTRPYWPNSPFAGREGENPNQTDRGDRHTWDARAEGYRNIIPRFCSEFGHQSPPSLAALARVLTPADLAIGSAAMHHRQRGTGGMAKHIDECLAEHFPPPKDFAEWHKQAQEMQARALTIGIETLATHRPRCMGALIWQLNDAWPGMSWSLIDSDGTPKPAYYAVQEAFSRIGI